MRIAESIVINRSPDDVFEFLAARHNDPVWMSAVLESEWLDAPGPVDAGRRGRMAMKMLGRRVEYVDEVTEYVPGRKIAHRTIEGPFDLRTACLCNPVDGGCRTTLIAEADRMLGPLSWVLAPLAARLMRRAFKADLTTLWEILEASAQTRSGDVRQPRTG